MKHTVVTNKKSYWIKSGLFTLFEKGSVFFFGFGSTYILLRALTLAEFGVWELFLAIVSFVEVGRIGLLQNALVKYLATSEKENYGLISTASFMLNGILSLISALVLLLIAVPISIVWEASDLAYMLQVYALTTTILIPFFQFNFIQQGNFDFKGIFWSNFVRQVLFFAYVIFFYISGTKITLPALATFQVVTAIGGTITSWYFARKYLKFSKKIDWNWVKKLFHFGKFVFGTNISTMLYKSIDKMMLGSLLSPVAVGLYGMSIRITNLTDVPTFSIAAIVFPQSARQMKTQGKEAIKKLYEKSVGAIIAFLSPFILFILLFPEMVIEIIASEKYLDAVPILRLTMLYGLFMPFAVQFGTVLDSIGKPKINFFFTLASTVLNIGFNYFFIINMGIIGAAYATLLTYGLTFIGMQILLYKTLDIRAYNAFYHAWKFYFQGIEIIKNFKKSEVQMFKKEKIKA